MKNIIISLAGSLIVLYLLSVIGINGFLMTIIMPITPVLIYAKLTTYKTKPFIISIIVGIVVSFLVYFVLKVIGVMFGLGDSFINDVAYVSAFVGFLISILTYRKQNK